MLLWRSLCTIFHFLHFYTLAILAQSFGHIIVFLRRLLYQPKLAASQSLLFTPSAPLIHRALSGYGAKARHRSLALKLHSGLQLKMLLERVIIVEL